MVTQAPIITAAPPQRPQAALPRNMPMGNVQTSVPMPPIQVHLNPGVQASYPQQVFGRGQPTQNRVQFQQGRWRGQQGPRPVNQRGNNQHGSIQPPQQAQYQKPLQYWKCGEEGHVLRDCPINQHRGSGNMVQNPWMGPASHWQ